MTAVAIGPLAAGNPARYAALAAMLALLVGLLAVVAWLARLGFIADLLSRPVLVGYLAGVALIMIAGQLGRLTGVQVTGETFIAQVVSFAGRLAQVNPGDVLIAAAVLVFLFTAQSRWPRLPGPLAAVLLSTAVCAIFGLGQHGVALVGHIVRISSPWIAGFPATKLATVGLMNSSEVRGAATGTRDPGVVLVAPAWPSVDAVRARRYDGDRDHAEATRRHTRTLPRRPPGGAVSACRSPGAVDETASRMSHAVPAAGPPLGLAAGCPQVHTQADPLTATWPSILGVLLFARPPCRPRSGGRAGRCRHVAYARPA